MKKALSPGLKGFRAFWHKKKTVWKTVFFGRGEYESTIKCVLLI